jgi:hypothetical protein
MTSNFPLEIYDAQHPRFLDFTLLLNTIRKQFVTPAIAASLLADGSRNGGLH